MLDLFSGIGGFALAAQWVWGADLEIVSFCEMDPYCQRVLRKHWPDVPIVEDVRNVKKIDANTKGERKRSELQRGKVKLERSEERRNFTQLYETKPPIDLITGGFPCQPFSGAGKRAGKSDNSYLWPEMLRVITEFEPAWVVAENVPGILSMVEFDMCPKVDAEGYAVGEVGEIFDRTGHGITEEILGSLESAGYEVQPFVIPAVACDAYHRRDRVWIVGYSSSERASGDNRRTSKSTRLEVERNTLEETRGDQGEYVFRASSQNASNTISKHEDKSRYGAGAVCGERQQSASVPGCSMGNAAIEGLQERQGERSNNEEEQSPIERTSFMAHSEEQSERAGLCESGERGERGGRFGNACCQGAEWLPEPDVGRVADGVSSRVDRLRGLGNAVVPEVPARLFEMIKYVQAISGLNNREIGTWAD